MNNNRYAARLQAEMDAWNIRYILRPGEGDDLFFLLPKPGNANPMLTCHCKPNGQIAVRTLVADRIDTEPSFELLTLLNTLNADARYVKWYHREEAVLAEMEFLASEGTEDEALGRHLLAMLVIFSRTLDKTTPRIIELLPDALAVQPDPNLFEQMLSEALRSLEEEEG